MPFWSRTQPAADVTLFIGAVDQGVCRISFDNDLPTDWERDDSHPLLREAARQLELYFSRRLKVFGVPVVLEGTPFQQAVWRQLQKIPYGAVISYAQLAERVGARKAFRAVGGANGRNPVPIIVPCHRVINSGGGLGGYSCGLPRKRRLLELEGVELDGVGRQMSLLASLC